MKIEIKHEIEQIKQRNADLEHREWKIYLNTVFNAVQLPASIADLDPCLADVNRNALSHLRRRRWGTREGGGGEEERDLKGRRVRRRRPMLPILEPRGTIYRTFGCYYRVVVRELRKVTLFWNLLTWMYIIGGMIRNLNWVCFQTGWFYLGGG